MKRYVKPDRVVSPKDYVENVKVIFDGGVNSFSIAELEWEGGKCLGMRWNVARREHDDPHKINGSIECKGMPTSRSYPVWFILPDSISNYLPQIIKDEEKNINGDTID